MPFQPMPFGMPQPFGGKPGMVPFQLPPGFGGIPQGPMPQGPIPFEGGFGGGFKPQPSMPQMPPQFAQQMPGFAQQPGFGMQPPSSMGFAGPSPFAGLMQMFQQMQGGMGMNSGGMGSRGPAPSPFLGLNRFAGPFGNGGGPIAPSFGQPGFGMGGGSSPQGMGIKQWF